MSTRTRHGRRAPRTIDTYVTASIESAPAAVDPGDRCPHSKRPGARASACSQCAGIAAERDVLRAGQVPVRHRNDGTLHCRVEQALSAIGHRR